MKTEQIIFALLFARRSSVVYVYMFISLTSFLLTFLFAFVDLRALKLTLRLINQ